MFAKNCFSEISKFKGELERHGRYGDQEIQIESFVTNQPEMDLTGLSQLDKLKLLKQMNEITQGCLTKGIEQSKPEEYEERGTAS